MAQSRTTTHPTLWAEGLAALAVLGLLLYDAQLLWSGYAYTPQPTGFSANLQAMVAPLVTRFEGNPAALLTLPLWFGFQGIGVLVVVLGVQLGYQRATQRGAIAPWLQHHLLALLWPFWTVTWLGYPGLWALALATNSDLPTGWQMFVGAVFPLVPDWSGFWLKATASLWWVVPLLLSLTLLSPGLEWLRQRWGLPSLLLVSGVLTVAFRALAIYGFTAQPPYVWLQGTGTTEPLRWFLAHLLPFVVGFGIGQTAAQQQGPINWATGKLLAIAVPLYALGFVGQFYRAGWIVADSLVAIGLTFYGLVMLRLVTEPLGAQGLLRWVGKHRYSYFLVAPLVVDRTLKLVPAVADLPYGVLLLGLAIATLLLALIVDAARPLLQKLVLGLLTDLDYVLRQTPPPGRDWQPQVGDTVVYQGQSHWQIRKVETLLDADGTLRLCQVSDGQQILWVPEHDLAPPEMGAEAAEVRSKADSASVQERS